MVGLFGTLGTANKGLNAQQKALETTGHNIANANTPGYSRQRVNMQADSPYNVTGIGQVGTGVKINSIIRVVDDFVIGNIRTENSAYNYYSQKADVLGQLETIFNETPFSKGLSSDLATYFDAWSKLGTNPELDNAKTIVLEDGNILTDTINHMAKQIAELSANSLSNLEKSTLDFNGKMQQLDTLNRQIYKVANDGSVPNDLLDQRDAILEGLSDFTKLATSFDQYGRVSVSISGQEVLTHNSLKTISVVVGKDTDGKALVSNGGDSLKPRDVIDQPLEIGQILISDNQTAEEYQALEMTSGAAKGLQEAMGELKQRMSELNNLAFGLAKSVNMIHSDNGKGIDFFELGTDDNFAINIKVNGDIKKDPSKINTGQDLANHEVGDGSRAAAIAKLKDLKLKYPIDLTGKYDQATMTIKNEEGGLTFLGAFVDIVTKNGISKQQADNTVASQDYLLSQLEQRRDSISGVNINEEVSDVMRFQRAFQANSRVISVISEMLDTLINRTGV
ncbi:flagellar hook-associated protein FlgK [Vagococcus sp. BWB3-3]|uniref:Flagellar hook-associated protein 1 n=1 Tax=Vagococcus allomyrinae TaxID=2794353 RepID=A0A940SV65_9ENTE|nr:flagellar hook-associated protein FlgK [Vagococcus allomyrinae]MBP1042015.1 flagellar hook-associated protein FlgK [Vagococcus allomyrinae]